MGLGELYNFPQWGPGQSSGRIRILVYFELENRTWRQHFFTNALRKKQLYWQVPERRSKIYANKKFPGGEFRISGGIFPGCMSRL